MKLGRKIYFIAAFAALAMFAVGGTAGVATGDVHPPTGCTWTVDKTATTHGGTTPITSLDLSGGQTITVTYQIVVTRSCPDSFDPFGEGGSADVVDSYAGILAQHLFLESTSTFATHTFTYTRDITASTCDSFDVPNTVDVRDGDPLHPFATDSLTIHVNVHCAPPGCTLTQGYWKTHSAQGPAPFDDNWNNVPNVYPGAASGLAENTPFYFSGQTWYGVFWTSPSKGNAYYILAHQYEAAVLNILNGASSTSAVDSALAAATTYFNNAANTPASALNLSKSARNTLLGYATTLGNYNTGLIGPGHCSEDDHSSTSA